MIKKEFQSAPLSYLLYSKAIARQNTTPTCIYTRYTIYILICKNRAILEQPINEVNHSNTQQH